MLAIIMLMSAKWVFNLGIFFNFRSILITEYWHSGFQIELVGVTSEDQGTWQCKVESYTWGHGKGHVTKSQMELVVLPKLKVSEGI